MKPVNLKFFMDYFFMNPGYFLLVQESMEEEGGGGGGEGSGLTAEQEAALMNKYEHRGATTTVHPYLSAMVNYAEPVKFQRFDLSEGLTSFNLNLHADICASVFYVSCQIKDCIYAFFVIYFACTLSISYIICVQRRTSIITCLRLTKLPHSTVSKRPPLNSSSIF